MRRELADTPGGTPVYIKTSRRATVTVTGTTKMAPDLRKHRVTDGYGSSTCANRQKPRSGAFLENAKMIGGQWIW